MPPWQQPESKSSSTATMQRLLLTLGLASVLHAMELLPAQPEKVSALGAGWGWSRVSSRPPGPSPRLGWTDPAPGGHG